MSRVGSDFWAHWSIALTTRLRASPRHQTRDGRRRKRRKCCRINREPRESRTHDQQIMILVNRVVDVAKSFGINGEPGGSRTHNLQIKSPNCPSFAELC